MTSHIKKITIEDLVVGMYVEDVFNKSDLLLLSANSIITDSDQIEALKRQGVSTLYINVNKGSDLAVKEGGLGPQLDELHREVEYYKELEQARIIHRKTLETAREVLDSIKNGRNFSVSKVEVAAEEIVESILRNQDALISLCQIKGYDEYTYTHSVNVSILSTSLAVTLGYDLDRLLDVGIGGVLHDIGKMRVPERILNKPGKYVEWEFNIMKRHPSYGLEIANEKKGISEVSKAIIIQHHERVNGKGYPLGLKGDQITEIGLISTVADVYDALTSTRIYRSAWTPQKALAFIYQGCDDEFPRAIVERFAKQMGIYPVGSFVRLFSGEMGVVTRVDRGNLLAPIVLILFDTHGLRLDSPVEYDLSVKQKEKEGQRYNVEVSLNPRLYRINVAEFISEKYF